MSEENESPQALQMAARVEKTNPPPLDEIFAACALGVIRLLDDHRSLPGGEWHAAVSSWRNERIRKIMRRGRASNWERCQEVPGLTVRYGSATVRIFVPGVMADAPPALSKLQIQSSPLEEPQHVTHLEEVTDPTLTILLNPEVEMSWGKQCAQIAHAAQRCWEQLDRADRLDWNAATRPVRVVTPTTELWNDLLPQTTTQIRDGGFTEVAPGTLTAAALLTKS